MGIQPQYAASARHLGLHLASQGPPQVQEKEFMYATSSAYSSAVYGINNLVKDKLALLLPVSIIT
jgi:hypothetical protein